MRCKYLQILALPIMALAVLVSALAAAEDLPSTKALTEKPAVAAPSPSKSKLDTPTPAKHRQGGAAKSAEVVSKDEPAGVSTSQMDKTAGQAKVKKADDPLQPIPDAMESGPVSIEAASFKGVVPGTSSKTDVESAWGKPKETARPNGTLVQLYSVEPFNRVEVNYDGDKVSSVIVRFDRAFPADLIAKQLDLATVRPVLVSNELGEVLGLAYPERGVLFAFEAGKDPSKPSMKVTQLVLEPISAEPFVLRAETTLENRCDPEPPRPGAGAGVGAGQCAGSLVEQPCVGGDGAAREGGDGGRQGRPA